MQDLVPGGQFLLGKHVESEGWPVGCRRYNLNDAILVSFLFFVQVLNITHRIRKLLLRGTVGLNFFDLVKCRLRPALSEHGLMRLIRRRSQLRTDHALLLLQERILNSKLEHALLFGRHLIIGTP